MRFCVHCQIVLHGRNRSTWCGDCARRYKCRECSKEKFGDDLNYSRCASCRARNKRKYARVYDTIERCGGHLIPPPWIEGQIEKYRRLAEQGLPLFGS